jgi:hypothetical protein
MWSPRYRLHYPQHRLRSTSTKTEMRLPLQGEVFVVLRCIRSRTRRAYKRGLFNAENIYSRWRKPSTYSQSTQQYIRSSINTSLQSKLSSNMHFSILALNASLMLLLSPVLGSPIESRAPCSAYSMSATIPLTS